MNTATIEVKSAEPPKDGKKQGVVRTTNGEVFGVWPDKLGLLRPGRSYRVEFDERPFNGKTYRTIRKAEPQEINGQSNGHGQRHPANYDVAGEMEFVTRILAASISACAVEYTQAGITQTARMLRTVYRDVFG